jgi:hypothetical protein
MIAQEIVNTPSPESRIIFRHNNLIFKFDPKSWLKNDDSQTKEELALWDQIEEQDKKHFQPILYHGETWVAQQIIEFSDNVYDPDNWPLIEGLSHKYRLSDIEQHKNWGTRIDGTPIIYDYGV